ncbi:MAG: branched-chain amino acid ABC transporter permease [Rhodobacteraceae bacterium]|nr:branched-chain amino acid ABC transporter permease [Paracoccaceae bacterium]
MPLQLLYGIEAAINGLMTGVMYSLVALGFVLIFKASGVFNYAQGVMALFAALTLVGLQNGQVPFAHLINTVFGTHLDRFGWHLPALLAILLAIGVMILFAILVERYLLKYLVGQDPIILFMATIGLAYFMEGFGDLMWGSDIKVIDMSMPLLGLPDGLPQGGSLWIEEHTQFLGDERFYGFFIDKLDIVGAGIAAILVISLMVFSRYTKTGTALRAVADDNQAALSVGISLRTIWVIVWAIAGFVALVAGVMWGAKSGVQFSLSLITLKALPVLMLGGFTSIPGAIIGGMIIGMGEKVFEFIVSSSWFGDAMGFTLNATENWFAYVLALLFLVFRPQGLFGEKIIERV